MNASTTGCADDTRWLCFTDPDTGRNYKSRAAAARSVTDLGERASSTAVPVCDTERTTHVISAAAKILDATRLRERTIQTYPCAEHRNERAERWRNGSEAGETTEVLVVNLEDGALPLQVTLASSSFVYGAIPAVRQDYLDDLRRRRADGSALEELRLALQTKHGRPLVYSFAYGREANLRTIRDLVGAGCTYYETPVFGNVQDLICHLSSLVEGDVFECTS